MRKERKLEGGGTGGFTEEHHLNFIAFDKNSFFSLKVTIFPFFHNCVFSYSIKYTISIVNKIPNLHLIMVSEME